MTFNPAKREYAILQMLVQGYRTKEIAHELGVSTHTIEFLSGRLRKKFNARNLVHLAAIAVAHRLVDCNTLGQKPLGTTK